MTSHTNTRSLRTMALICAMGAVSALAGCGAQSQTSPSAPAAQRNAAPATAAVTVVANPDNRGQQVLTTLESAKYSIDIAIYQISDQAIAQALADRINAGVTVRLMMDGGGNNAKYNAEFVNQMLLPKISGKQNLLQSHFASNNFALTHQKAIIIDAAPGAPSSTSPTLLVSTGNFQTYVPKTGAAQEYWSARDYYVTVTDPQVVAEAEAVFASDFSCAGIDAITPLTPGSPLVWSNGTTGLYADNVTASGAQTYPRYPDELYTYQPSPAGPSPTNQGNSLATQLALISSAQAGQTLRVNNEEMNDFDISNALIAAAQRGVSVQVVMTYPGASTPGKTGPMDTLVNIAKAGGKVVLFAPQKVVPEALYIHGKMIVLTGGSGPTRAFVGSENFSQASLGWNRELGIMLDGADAEAAAGISVLSAAFDADTQAANTAVVNPAAPNNGIPTSWDGSQAPVALGAEALGLTYMPETGAYPPAPPAKCGPIS